MSRPCAVHPWATLSLLLVALPVCDVLHAAELKGTVVEVAGTTVKIRLEGEKLPSVGDKVQIGSDVPGVGFVAVEGTWRVSQADGQVIVATPDGAAAGKPTPGMAARVDSAAPQERPRRVPGTGTPATSRVDPKPRLEATGRPWLGVGLCGLAAAYAAQLGADEVRGVLVTEVFAGSPADKVGLMPEDIITGVDARPVAAPGELVETLGAMRPGQRVRVHVFRERAERMLEVELAGMLPDTEATLVDYGTAGFDMVVKTVRPREAKRAGLRAGTIVVTEVGTVAAAAGVQPGQVVVSCNGRPATTLNGLARLMYRLQIGDPVVLALKRGTEHHSARFQAGELPEPNGGALSQPVELAAIGLVVRELNRATAQHLGIRQTRGMYIERVSRPKRLPTGAAEMLPGRVIVWANGQPVRHLSQLRERLADGPAVRLLCRPESGLTVWAVLVPR